MAQTRVSIVGGRLQGIEAAYLCSKAGFTTSLIDSDSNPAAKSLSDEFHQIDILAKPEKTKRVLRQCDAVLPAIENRKALFALQKLCRELQIPFMQDNEAFWITSDKAKSSKFLRGLRIPIPEPWPESGLPLIVKPSNKSGSESVYRADDKNELKKVLEIVKRVDGKPVVQKFIEGPAISLEVISRKGVGQPLQITGLEFDERYGCKRVFAPVQLPPNLEERTRRIGMRIASSLKLNGLTDVQALLEGATPRVNEINARLPSQTPSVVYHSTGINIVELLVKLFLDNRLLTQKIHSQNAVLYQHMKILGHELRVQGEHVMADAPDLRMMSDFLGADEAITNLEPGVDASNRVATLIIKSQDLTSASKKMEKVVENIMSEYDLTKYADPFPGKVYHP
jgi:pyrrolysine biosynthesis protein PylC